MHKRGQEGIGIGTLVGLVIAGVALVLIVMAIYNYYSPIVDFPGKADIDIAFISQKCSNSLTFDPTGSDYCLGLIEVATNMYINCDYAVSSYGISLAEGVDKPTCESTAKTNMCNRLSGRGEDITKIKVNAELCVPSEAN